MYAGIMTGIGANDDIGIGGFSIYLGGDSAIVFTSNEDFEEWESLPP